MHVIPLIESSVRRQCLGTCATNATLTWLEYLIARQVGRHQRLSLSYTLGGLLADNTLVALRHGTPMGASAGPRHVLWAIEEWGLLPHEAWRPRVGLFHGHLRGLLARLETIARLDGRLLDDEDILVRARSTVNDVLGVPPTHFKHAGATLTPNEFADRFRLPRADDLTSVDLEEDPEFAFDLVRHLIDDGQPVLASLPRDGHWDKTSGVISREFVRAEHARTEPVGTPS